MVCGYDGVFGVFVWLCVVYGFILDIVFVIVLSWFMVGIIVEVLIISYKYVIWDYV